MSEGVNPVPMDKICLKNLKLYIIEYNRTHATVV